jgi:hypothetical protein
MYDFLDDQMGTKIAIDPNKQYQKKGVENANFPEKKSMKPR